MRTPSRRLLFSAAIQLWLLHAPARAAQPMGDFLQEKFRALRASVIRPETAPDLRIATGEVGVSSAVFPAIATLGRQGSTRACARYAFAAAARAEGIDLDIARVEKVYGQVIRASLSGQLASLDARIRVAQTMGDAAAVETLRQTRSRIQSEFDIARSNPEESVPTRPNDVVESARELGFSTDNLDPDADVMTASLKAIQGQDADRFLALSAALKQKILSTVSEGRPVMAAVYWNSSERHYITVLESGLNSAGQRVARVFDSGPGTIGTVDWRDFYPVRGFVFTPAGSAIETAPTAQ